MLKIFLIIILVVDASLNSLAQENTIQDVNLTKNLTNHFVRDINSRVARLTEKVEEKALKTLEKFEKHEKKLQKKLAAKDSLSAANLFPSLTQKAQKAENIYKQLAAELKVPSASKTLNEYIPQFDSLKTSLKFLNQPSALTSKLPTGITEKIKLANTNIQSLETKLQQANEIKNYMKERKQLLKEQFEKYGMPKELKKLNKQVYYYQQQLNEYKDLLKDPKKIEARAIAELRKLPVFTEFMKKNSQLAQLFRLPDNYGNEEILAGLQTRASVQNQLQERFGASASSATAAGGATSYLQQQMSVAQGELSKLKDKVNNPGGGSSDLEMPDFKPNSQKTKSFLKRIEYGANVQSQKTNSLLPVTSDLALTAGYKLNDKSVIGIGASYKLGWGSGWKDIKITNEGVGLRSYLDWKLKPIFGKIEGFWISGGYEQNYQRAFSGINQLKDLNAWQTSGLMGLTKKYKIGKKTNNLQLLWDFLSYRQLPRRQPVLFRVGHVF